MTQWMLSLLPTTRPGSVSPNLQLDYQWATYTALPHLTPVSVLPPVLSENDTLIVQLHLSSIGGTPIAAGDISLSHEMTAPAGFPSGAANELSNGMNQWSIYTVPPPETTPSSRYQTFKFRISITCTPAQPGSDPTIYTVDPEMIVGPGDGSGGLTDDKSKG